MKLTQIQNQKSRLGKGDFYYHHSGAVQMLFSQTAVDSAVNRAIRCRKHLPWAHITPIKFCERIKRARATFRTKLEPVMKYEEKEI